jgi:hypothetical protein
MELPTPQSAVAALASFVRSSIAGVGDTLGPLLARLDAAAVRDEESAQDALRAARNLATVIVTAATPFAQTSYARARLLRQMHATGLLSEQEAEQTLDVLGVAG